MDEEGQVVPVITIHDPSVEPDKVIFKTRSGTEFKREKFDKTTGRYVLNLVGGNANDGQELYALYPKPGSVLCVFIWTRLISCHISGIPIFGTIVFVYRRE
ncbi:hypothetical protein [uncultured Culturomica sp.]|uniref:hypothetical protein n=1 Tax=uncultured Culturomica sp. TaxID=1926654 RepID=UPI0025998C31|nr:hypothetical protein [uncultured Culturomica sp.]